MTNWAHPEIGAWEARGRHHHLVGFDIFAVDLPAAVEQTHEPLLVLHGFPTSSFDFAGVADALAAHRRVVLVDLLGYGLSEKPDIAYSMALQADVVIALAREVGLDRLVLLTHDMGDTVGGELLARQMEGAWPVEITRRVVTNGSIYVDMAHLTAGQHFLLSQPDELIAAEVAPDGEALARSLVATLAPAHADVIMDAHSELIAHGGGNRVLARLIRYIEERRANERRFTGAIESHPSPLSIVWGPEDPIAVAAMAEKLQTVRPDAAVRWVEGAGHYPQIESPDGYLAAIGVGLG